MTSIAVTLSPEDLLRGDAPSGGTGPTTSDGAKLLTEFPIYASSDPSARPEGTVPELPGLTATASPDPSSPEVPPWGWAVIGLALYMFIFGRRR